MNPERGYEAREEQNILPQCRVQICVLVFFAALFLYGCFAVRDYGISVDEDVERTSSLVTYQYLVPAVRNVVTDSVNFPELAQLDTYTDRYYGVAVQLPLVVMEHLTGFRMPLQTVFLMRHFYTFLLFFVAAATFYFLGKRLTGNRWAALFGVVMLVISPRMLAESFYNIKDIVFLSFVIYNLYAAVCFLDRPSVKNGIVLAVVSALCTNVRVVGAVVMAACVTVGLIKGIAEKRFWKQCLVLAGVSVLCMACYILSLPVLWKDPVGELMNTVRTFSDFTNWDDIFRYRGFPVRGSDLPRSYLFVWIFISTPVLYLALFMLGIGERFVAWAGNLWMVMKKRRVWPDGETAIIGATTGAEAAEMKTSGVAVIGTEDRKTEDAQMAEIQTEVCGRTDSDTNNTEPVLMHDFWCHILLGLVLVVPLCYVVLRKPTLYNGWRHFYFLYAVILLYALEGTVFLWRVTAGNRWMRRICAGVIGTGMVLTLCWMVRNHPYEYMYFNPLIRSYALENFELDYWAVSEADMFRYICEQDDRPQIRLWCTFSDYYKSLLMLSEEERQRLVYVSTPMEADYAVCRDLLRTSVEQMERQFAFEEIHAAVVDGCTINAVFRRTEEMVAKSTILCHGGVMQYSVACIDWQQVPEGGSMALVTDLGMETALTSVSLRYENQDMLNGFRLFVSADGASWTEAVPVERNEAYILYSKKTVFGSEGRTRYLKLVHRDGLFDAEAGPALEVELFAALGSGVELSAPSMIERVTGHENAVASVQAVDGSVATRWQSERVQEEGIAFDIVLNDVYTLSGIYLDPGNAASEYPRKLRIFATKDDVNWEELNVQTADQRLFTFPAAQVRTIRLLTGNMDGMDVQDRWSISEIAFMKTAE